MRKDDPAEYLVGVWDNLLTLGVALEEHLSTLGGHAATFSHEDRDLLTPAGANFVAGLAQLSDREWTRRFQHKLVESGVECDESATHM